MTGNRSGASSLRRGAWASGLLSVVGSLFWAGVALAQEPAADDGAAGAGAESVAPVQVQTSEPEAQQSVQTTFPYGLPSPGFNPDAHLPSSSQARTDINQGDSFDLGGATTESRTLHGNPDALGVFSSSETGGSGVYVVKPGDTLSKISGRVFGQRLMWPKLWSMNPQIQNPHWIYPGDQILLSSGGNGATRALTLGAGSGLSKPQLVPKDAVFLRRLGYIDDPREGVLGEVVGAREPVQLIGQAQHIYLELRPEVALREGQILTIFEAVRNPPRVRGARRPPGQLVSILGSAKVEYWNPKTRVARAQVTETADVIERGAKVGLLGRQHVVVSARPANTNVSARVLTSMYPNEMFAQHDVLFIDRGSSDGLVEGNRLFVIRRGDTWRRTLSTTKEMARSTIRMNSAERVEVVPTPLRGDEQDFPEEIVAELRVIKAHKYSSLVLVTHARVEIEPGDRAVARAGF